MRGSLEPMKLSTYDIMIRRPTSRRKELLEEFYQLRRCSIDDDRSSDDDIASKKRSKEAPEGVRRGSGGGQEWVRRGNSLDLQEWDVPYHDPKRFTSSNRVRTPS